MFEITAYNVINDLGVWVHKPADMPPHPAQGQISQWSSFLVHWGPFLLVVDKLKLSCFCTL